MEQLQVNSFGPTVSHSYSTILHAVAHLLLQKGVLLHSPEVEACAGPCCLALGVATIRLQEAEDDHVDIGCSRNVGSELEVSIPVQPHALCHGTVIGSSRCVDPIPEIFARSISAGFVTTLSVHVCSCTHHSSSTRLGARYSSPWGKCSLHRTS